MKILDRMKRAWGIIAQDPNTQLSPYDDFWYQNPGHHTATGLRISPESAMRVAAVFACTRVTSETVGSLPCILYRHKPNGGKERATDHPLYKLLHDRPNQWQTPMDFWQMMQAHLELRGNAYAVIVPGTDRAIDQLIPLHPDRVSVFRVNDGSLKYLVRHMYSGETSYYLQEEMLHLRGLSSDGLVGISTVAVGAEAIACGLGAQEFAGRFFENAATPSGILVHPKGLSPDAFERLKKSIREAQTGDNRHKLMVLEEDMKWQNMGLTNKDSQLIEAREFSKADICSLFRVPPHKIGDLSRATFSNIEHQNVEFATDCIRPRLVRLEQRINNDLIDAVAGEDQHEYFCEFLMDALLRGDKKSTYEAYGTGITNGFITRNEARIAENYNPIAGLDAPLMPLNMQTVGGNGSAATSQSDVEDGTATGAVRDVLPHERQALNGHAKKSAAQELAQ